MLELGMYVCHMYVCIMFCHYRVVGYTPPHDSDRTLCCKLLPLPTALGFLSKKRFCLDLMHGTSDGLAYLELLIGKFQ